MIPENEMTPQPEPQTPPKLKDQTEFRLSPDQWDAFCRRLDEPAKVIPELQQLFHEQELF